MLYKHPIVVVERDPASQSQIGTTLRLSGFPTLFARDASEALRLAYWRQPHLFLLRHRAGEQECGDMLRRIREYTDTPVIVISEAADSATRARLLELGANECLTDSSTEQDLVESVVKHVADPLLGYSPTVPGDGQPVLRMRHLRREQALRLDGLLMSIPNDGTVRLVKRSGRLRFIRQAEA